MQTILSPNVEVFSTPPTSPNYIDPTARGPLPPLSRRNSRPSTLQIDHNSTEWKPDIELETTSPLNRKTMSAKPSHQNISHPEAASKALPPPTWQPQMKSMKSPCFIHSHLDKASDWLRAKAMHGELGVAKSLQRRTDSNQLHYDIKPPTNGHSSRAFGNTAIPDSLLGGDIDDDDDFGSSLTKQLAETAVGVRELSKQLGRARVRSNIQNVLIITKARDNRLIKLTRELALYLMLTPRHGSRGLVVYVDKQLRDSRRFDAAGIERDHPELFVPLPRRRSSSSSLSSLSSASTSYNGESVTMEEGQLRYWTSTMCAQSPHLFDFVVTLGGDGTVLFTSWLFQHIVPPVLSFALGSLGFLTNFDFADHRGVMDSVLETGIRVNLRMRFTCTVYRAVAVEEGKGRKAVKKGETGEIIMKNVEQDGWEALEGGYGHDGVKVEGGKCGKDKEIMCFTTRPVETFEVLNDLVVDRGPSPYVSLLELFGDEHHMTTVQADGLTVSTPTGSTAYSLSAGGSLVHPEIPALLITPICPHTLSFRPMLLPDSMELRICVPFNSRSTAWASFDGRGRVELKQGDHIKVTASKYPFPTVCADKQSTDWFHSISRTLKWNERERQKSFVVVEEGPSKSKRRAMNDKQSILDVDRLATAPKPVDEAAEDEEEEVSDEDDKFDINDSSPEAASATASPSVSSASETEAANHQSLSERAIGGLKARTVAAESSRPLTPEEEAAAALSQGNPFMRAQKSRSRSRSGLHSGVDTPGRYAGSQPHPPRISRQVEFTARSSSPTNSVSSADSFEHENTEQHGTRDDIHSPRASLSSGRSRIPKDRDVEAESMNMKTPTVPDLTRRAHHHRMPEHHPPHRAFAVWGQDESGSSASDSDP